MDRLELVETVREKTGVGYADAKEALDACGDDLLDALVWLEVRGRSQTRSAYASTGTVGGDVSSEMRAAQSAYERSSATGARAMASWFSRVRSRIARSVRRGLETKVVSRRGGGGFLTLPLLPVVVGEALWLMLDLMLMLGSYRFYYLFRGIILLSSLVAPVVCFFYLLFGCRIERHEEEAPAVGSEPWPRPHASEATPPDSRTASAASPSPAPDPVPEAERTPDTAAPEPDGEGADHD